MAEDKGTKTEGNAKANEAEAEPKVRKDIVPPEYRKRYQELGGTCGDFIAAELTSMMDSGGIDSLNTVKAENSIPKERWSSLNHGQQRMNLSNTLRASFLRGETIKIAGKEYNLNAMRDEFGNLDPTDRKSQGKFLEFVQMPNTDRNAKAIQRVFHDLPEKARLRAEREDQREKAKAEKEAKKKADAEAKAKAKADKADKPAKGKGKGKGGDTPTEAKQPEAADA